MKWFDIKAFIENVEHSILSLGKLASHGWSFALNAHAATLMQESAEAWLDVFWFSSCPWIQADRIRLSKSRKSSVLRSQLIRALHPIAAREAACGTCKSDGDHKPSCLKKVRFKQPHMSLSGMKRPAADDALKAMRRPASEMKRAVGSESEQSEDSFMPPEQKDLCSDLQLVSRYALDIPPEVHSQRGHNPYDPECNSCARARGVSRANRKDRPKDFFQIQVDYFYLEGITNKLMAIAHPATGCIFGFSCSNNAATTSQRLRMVMRYLGMIGPGQNVEIVCDSESALAKMVRGMDLEGRHCLVTVAAPERHTTVGAAERAVRTLKELAKTIEWELKDAGLRLVRTERNVQWILDYITLSHNSFSMNGQMRAPRDELYQKSMPNASSAPFGSVVMAEPPESVAAPRFVKAVFLALSHAGQLGGVCAWASPDGYQVFRAKSIKVQVPTTYDEKIVPGLFEKINPDTEDSSMVREVDPAEQREIPAVPVIPTLRSGNPPSSWYLAHGKTPGCIACEKGFKGRVHSVGCKERYKRWVEEQQGIPSRDEPHAPESDQRDVNLDVQGTEAAKPEVSPDSAGSGIVRDVPPVALREPSVPLGSVGVSGSVDVPASAQPARVPRDEPMELDISGQNPMPSSSHVVSAESEAEEMEITDVDARPELSHEDAMQEALLLNAFRCNVWNDADQTTAIELCGGQVFLHHPTKGLDEYTGEEIPPQEILEGMILEIQQMHQKSVGRLVFEDEAKRIAAQRGESAISSRWVLARKTKYNKRLCRSRCVAQEVAHGPSAAVLGISSATVSSDAVKSALAIAGHGDQHVGTLDVSTAYMSSPLPKGIQKLLRLPSGVRDSQGRPVFLDLSNSINGLRCASKAWMTYLATVVSRRFPHMFQGELEPSCFAGAVDGAGVTLLCYVDDLLICTSSEAVFEKMLATLQHDLVISETGRIKSSRKGGGSIVFLGRKIERLPHDPRLHVSQPVEYWTILANMPFCKGLKPAERIPQLKQMLNAFDEASCKQLTEEASTVYRSVLGRIAWATPYRPDLAFAVSALSVGQSKPVQREERTLRALCRYVLGTGHFTMSFPSLHADSVRQESMSETDIICYTDASHAPFSHNERKSISGCCVFWLGSCIKSFSRTQTTTATSSTEAELQAIASGLQETIGLQKLLRQMLPGAEPKAFIINDNAAAQCALLRQDVQRPLRRADIRWNFIRGYMDSGKAIILWIEGGLNPSDLCTKVTSTDKLVVFRAQMGISDICRPPHEFRTHAPKPKAKIKSTPSRVEMEVDEEDVWMDDASEHSEPGDEQDSEVDPMEINRLLNIWEMRSKTKFLLIELCCETNSVLGCTFEKLGEAFQVWRVSQDSDLTRESTCASLIAALDTLGALSESERPKVWVHASLPCTGGSPLLYLRDVFPSHRVTHSLRRSMFQKLLKKAKRILTHRCVNHWSFELSSTCAYWKWRTVQGLRRCVPPCVKELFSQPLIHVGTARLCSSPETAGLSKRWRFITTSPVFAKAIASLSDCQCGYTKHSYPDYAVSGIYNRAVAYHAAQSIRVELQSPARQVDTSRVW